MKPAAAPSTAAATDSARNRHARRLDFLHRLAEAGMEKARGLVANITARVAADFERIAKAIRLAILLRRRLEEEGPGWAAAASPSPAQVLASTAEPLETPDPAERGEAAARPPRAERESAEPTGDPWLDRDDEAELDALPVAVLVQRLCEILDVPYDPDLWADALAPIGAERAPDTAAQGRPLPGRAIWREPPARPLRRPEDPRPPPRPSG